jgi:4-hydroxybenzoyl-CoA reductase subunit beta
LVKEAFPAFHRAVKEVASKHIRNMASIGGNVCLDTRCWYYNQTKLWRDAREPCYKLGGTVCFTVKGSPRCHAINNSDTAPALIALDAEVEVVKKGSKRTLPLKAFYQDDGASPNVLEPNEMVTAIKIPNSAADTTAVFIKECSRRGIDFANGSVAASVTGRDSKCSAVKIVVGSLGSFPRLLEEASQNIVQEGLTEQSIEKAAKTALSEFGTTTNLFTSAGYKRNLGEALVRRALDDIRRQMKEKGRAKP